MDLREEFITNDKVREKKKSIEANEQPLESGKGGRMKTVCGKTKNNKGKPFLTGESVAEHEKQCPKCISLNRLVSQRNEAVDDIPDGAYWALKLEGYPVR